MPCWSDTEFLNWVSWVTIGRTACTKHFQRLRLACRMPRPLWSTKVACSRHPSKKIKEVAEIRAIWRVCLFVVVVFAGRANRQSRKVGSKFKTKPMQYSETKSLISSVYFDLPVRFVTKKSLLFWLGISRRVNREGHIRAEHHSSHRKYAWNTFITHHLRSEEYLENEVEWTRKAVRQFS